MFGYSVEDVAALTIEHRSGVIGNLVTVFNGVQHREERRLEVFFERASVELTTDFVVGAPEDSFLVHRADEPHAQRYDVDALRRETFAADGFDPDRQVFVYQYFAHHAFATALRDGRRAEPRRGRRAPRRTRWSKPRTAVPPSAGRWSSPSSVAEGLRSQAR